jgi:GNAT superfamily N-acetyltransferase
MATTIRPANRADVGVILTFIRALAVYEREPDAAKATEDDLLRDGFGDNPYFQCLIAEQDGVPAGFAFYFFDYSTWLGKPGIYLEDLFVHPEFRGLGIGKALLQRVAAIAVEKNCGRLKWQVLDWNTPAINFYTAMGAEFMDTWRNVRVSGESLQRLAESTADPAPSVPLAPTESAGNHAFEKPASPTSHRAPSFPFVSAERAGDRESHSSSSDEEGAQ